ncbi:hypothetical protein CEXT_204241 [Caerostris extrusa]|uniref:Uncharacterized protein n=1 Tax=Caerostris extrusa TaxID=172846 RepID=A0AAV4XIY6_CAEEX|nr:hypothetical protein CEXT_204241 [Caerostris extrusa]
MSPPGYRNTSPNHLNFLNGFQIVMTSELWHPLSRWQPRSNLPSLLLLLQWEGRISEDHSSTLRTRDGARCIRSARVLASHANSGMDTL